MQLATKKWVPLNDSDELWVIVIAHVLPSLLNESNSPPMQDLDVALYINEPPSYTSSNTVM
jgi:hypothetical protein